MTRGALALTGVAAVGGVVGLCWWLWRRQGDTGSTGDVSSILGDNDWSSDVNARHQGNVFHRERADNIDQRLQAALDEYSNSGPMPITIVEGLRQGNAAAAQQLAYFVAGKSNARTLDQTAHGRGGAFDFAVVNTADGDRVASTFNPDDNPSAYSTVGQWFEDRGLTWGGRWSGFGANGDSDHIEVTDWQSLPYPPGAPT